MVMGYQAYAGNGLLDGITTGVGLRKAYDETKRQRGLAEGMEKIAKGDESGWADVAKNAPELYMRQQQWKAGNELSQKQFNALQNENAWKRQHQQDVLDFQRKQLEQNAIPSAIRELQYVNEHPELKDLYVQSKRGTNIYNNMSPFEKKRIENAASKMDENIAKANERIAMYDRGTQLLDSGVETGGIGGYVKKNLLPTASLSPETQEFQSLVSKLVPQQRPAGSGTTSDRDMAIYEKATIGLDKDTKTNRNILALGKAMAENDKAYEELRADWVSSGGGLSEFDKLWRKYANEQRIYNDDGTVNKNRVNPYDWFANGGSTTEQKQEQVIDWSEL